MKWHEFVEKLKEAKESGTSQGLSVHCITNLIFSRAFDSMLDAPPEGKEQIDVYTKMYEEVRKALGSKAKLPAPTKSDLIGLADVENEARLALWRHQTNPLSTFNFLDYLPGALKLKGFQPFGHDVYKWMKPAVKNRTVQFFVVEKWSKVFDNIDSTYFKSFAKRQKGLCLIGIVTDVKIKPYANNEKERMIVSIFTGKELVEDLIIWPGNDGKIKEIYKELVVPNSIGMMSVVPNVWNGRKSGSIQYWQEFL